jgi:hypothetical protein
METGSMSRFKNSDDFNERLSTGAKARHALLEKFRARPRADDPAVLERQAARLATGQARDARKKPVYVVWLLQCRHAWAQ